MAALFGKKAADTATDNPGTDDVDQSTDDTDDIGDDDATDIPDVVPDVKKDAGPDVKKDTKDTKDSGPDLQDEQTDDDVPIDDATDDDATDLADAELGGDAATDATDAGPDVDVQPDVTFDTGIIPVGCKVDSDCGAVSTPCAAQWLCLVDPVSQAGTCIASSPKVNGTPCDDGSPCTQNDVCNEGSCIGKLNTCEDSNPCTLDKCVASNGSCTHTAGANGIQCTDGDPCTVGDTCVAGQCAKFVANICDCKVDGDCAVQDSANPCDTKHICSANTCILGTPPTPCPKSTVACQDNVCDPTTGQCALVPVENGSACTDGNVCTYPDLCTDGVCNSPPLVCDDGNPCTDDSCVPGASYASGAGCQYTNSTAACDDGDACTGWGQCAAGVCTKGALDTAKCGCATDDDCAKLNTNCGGSFTCSAANACVLTPNSGITCTKAGNNACQTLTCDETLGACAYSYSDKTTVCDDGNVCTVGDHCDGAGKCVKTTSFDCNDGDPCTNDGCLLSVGCFHPYNTASCDDGSACTVSDKCTFGKCVGSPYIPGSSPQALICQCAVDADCSKYDANKCQAPHKCSSTKVCTLTGSVPPDPCALITNKSPCHTYACNINTGNCDSPNKLDGVTCSDGNWCTTGDACLSGTCTGLLNTCDDGNACTNDPPCDSSAGTAGCDQHPPVDDGTACSIADVCQLSQSCQSGACVGTEKVCNDNNPCTVDSCDPKTGCKYLPTTNGTICSDGNPCTGEDLKDPSTGGVNVGEDTCILGKCVPAAAKNCKVANTGPCYTSTCDPTKGANLDTLTGKYACVQAPSTAPCQGGDACIVSQACLNGVCSGGVTKNCDDANICTSDSCWSLTIDPLTPPGTCIHSALGPIPCDDLNSCTSKDTCSNSGVCGGKLLIFDDGNPCTLDACDPVTGPSHTPDLNGNCGPLAKCDTETPPQCVFASKPILISEFYIGVPNDPTDDWIEIHNPTANDVPIPSYAIQVAEAKPDDGIGWNTLAQTDTGAVIAAHGYMLFAHSSTVVGGQAADFVSNVLNFNKAQQVDGKGVGLVDANSAPIIVNVGQVRVRDNVNGLVQDRLCLDAGGCTDLSLSVTPVTLAMISSNSLERKANAASTADTMAYHGSEWLAGNDYVDGAMPNDNYVVRVAPDPQTAKSAVYEPACGGTCPAYQVCNFNSLAESCVDDTKCAIGCNSGTYCNASTCALDPAHLVFSEVLPGGQVDPTVQFIELYNADTKPVDLSDFQIQIKTLDKVQSDPWANLYQFPAGIILPSHRYYVIGTTAYAQTAGGLDALVTGSLGMDPTGGALRLWNPRTDVLDSDVKDAVGWGATLAYNNNNTYNAAPAPTPGNSIERKSMSADYADTLKPGGISCLKGNGLDTDADDQDWCEQDVPGAQSFASGQFEPACGGTCSKGLLCPFTGTTGGTCADPACGGTCNFQSATSGGGFACNIFLPTPACDLTGLVIAEVSPQGPTSTTPANGTVTGANNEYIMLYNRANQDIVLDNVYISYRYTTAGTFLKATDADVTKKPLTGVIHAHSYYLITPQTYDGKMAAPDFVSDWTWGLDPAKGTVRLSRYDTVGSSLTLDHLAWGNDQAMNAFGEPPSTKVAAPVCPGVDPTTLLTDGTPCAIRRLPMAGVSASDVTSLFSPWFYAGAGDDTGSNANDFIATSTRTPRNSCLQATGACPPNSPGVPQRP